MKKYKVFLKSGSVLEIEASLVSSNEVFVHFYQDTDKDRINSGSFPTAEIFGFYLADKVSYTSTIRGINQE